MRTRIALLFTALLLAGCTNSQIGAAAVVDGEKISVATVEASVTSLMSQRRAAGQPDSTSVANGDEARNLMRFHIISVLLRQLAQERGIVLSEGEKRAYRDQILSAVGGEEGLSAALTQNGIAEVDFDLYIEDVLYQRKLGERLVPGDAATVESQRNEAIQAALKEKYSAIVVNPRFGTFDSASGLIQSAENTNGAVSLPGL